MLGHGEQECKPSTMSKTRERRESNTEAATNAIGKRELFYPIVNGTIACIFMALGERQKQNATTIERQMKTVEQYTFAYVVHRG